MIIKTRQFGDVDVDETRIITMPKGMPGFPGMDRYTLLSHEEMDPFLTFQCLDDPELAFALMDPFLFLEEYPVDIDGAVKEMGWAVEKTEELFLYTIVNASGDRPEEITANLAGPILIHTGIHEAVQMVIPDERFSHQHPIF